MPGSENGADFVPTLAIVGVGLIGGSLALSLRQQQRVGRVIGVGRSRANLELARQRGVIDEILDDPAAAARRADIVVLATPVNTIADLFRAISPAIDASTVVTDVGSVKQPICEAALQTLGDSCGRFVPGHPVAGKEKSGVAAATPDLFENHNVVLTPTPQTDPDAVHRVRQMWQATGASVVDMAPPLHDRVLATTSHLPHVLAYAMVDYFASSADVDDCYDMAAGGFYDFTRTASSDPEMWRDICLMNDRDILAQIGEFRQTLDRIAALIERSDSQELDRLFARAREARAKVAERRKQ